MRPHPFVYGLRAKSAAVINLIMVLVAVYKGFDLIYNLDTLTG